MLHQHTSPAVAASYTLGAVSGASVTALLLTVPAGLASPIPVRLRAGLLLVVLALLALSEFGLLKLRLPERHWQIPREVFGSHRARAAFRFAFELGLGFRTYVTRLAPWALAATIVLTSAPGWSTLLGALAGAAGFGLGRSIPIIGQSTSAGRSSAIPPWALTAISLLSMATLATVAVSAIS